MRTHLMDEMSELILSCEFLGENISVHKCARLSISPQEWINVSRWLGQLFVTGDPLSSDSLILALTRLEVDGRDAILLDHYFAQPHGHVILWRNKDDHVINEEWLVHFVAPLVGIPAQKAVNVFIGIVQQIKNIVLLIN